ncbi:hypothetical protein SAMN04487969_15518 [Paenibacillus algorifonticola]|uniref:Uncharacterized protein n=1 Tax=Paenibacillus algorifonticola TaxID=684063 RepID=A0A1I2J3X2_9BACL|nr:hypothetical protein [Paenibacillus algorifonticola]SFF49442.1 hypothetical protein SAMN04487969_15518 [Paenibacillus algorifonticola]
MKARVLILGASRYKFPQEGTGEIIEGCKVHFVEEDGGEEENNIGRIPQTTIMDYEFYEYVKKQPLPSIFEADMIVSMRGKKPTLKIADFIFVEPINFAKSKNQQA